MRRVYELDYEEHFLIISPDKGFVPDHSHVRKVTENVDEVLMAVKIACEGPSGKYEPITIQIYQDDLNGIPEEIERELSRE